MTTTAATTLVSSAETSASIATKSSRDSASTMAVVQPRTYSIFVGYLIMWQAHYRYAQMFSVLSKKPLRRAGIGSQPGWALADKL